VSLGGINNIVSCRASNAHLAEQGFSMGLDRYICNNPSQGRFISNGLMATTMEAILGAVFLDAGCEISVLENVVVALGLSWPE
jgi:dsRNA-specific ribonuclease